MVVKQVAGVQLPEKITVPLASIVALFPAVSVILKIGGVAALADGIKAIMPKRHRSTNTCNLELKILSLLWPDELAPESCVTGTLVSAHHVAIPVPLREPNKSAVNRLIPEIRTSTLGDS